MSAPSPIAINTKACTEALGVERALTTVAKAGISGVVLWAGEFGQHVSAGVVQARALALPVLALALPRTLGLGARPGTLSESIGRAAELGIPAVSLMFGDSGSIDLVEADWHALVGWLRDLPVSPLVENSGRAADRFSDPRQLAALLADVPDLRVVLDLGHLASSGHAGYDASALAGRIAWVDVHDNDAVSDLHLALGGGTGNGSFIFGLGAIRTLPEWVVIETDPRIGDDPMAWVRAVQKDGARLRAALGARTRKGS